MYSNPADGLDCFITETVKQAAEDMQINGRESKEKEDEITRFIEKTRSYVEALSVLNFFADMQIGAMLAAYHNDPDYLTIPSAERQRIRNLLYQYNFCWYHEEKGHTIDSQLRLKVMNYLRLHRPDQYICLHEAAVQYYTDLIEELGNDSLWHDEIKYHRQEIIRCQ
jgi:hypothetical protein